MNRLVSTSLITVVVVAASLVSLRAQSKPPPPVPAGGAQRIAVCKLLPTAEVKKAYYNLARIIHPDLALDKEEKEKRHDLMAKLNDAYAAGDQNRLNKLVEDFRDSPDLIMGDSIGDQFVRAIRQIYQIKNRLKEIRSEKLVVELSELFILHEKFQAACWKAEICSNNGGNAPKPYQKSERRLENLRNVNTARKITLITFDGIRCSIFSDFTFRCFQSAGL